MAKVFKLETTITTLVSADSRQEAESRLSNMTIEEILENMDDGDYIGKEERGNLVEIPAGQIEDELLEVGNDGTFFDMD